jgi:hypothetical protein
MRSHHDNQKGPPSNSKETSRFKKLTKTIERQNDGFGSILLKKSEVPVHGKSAELPTTPSIDANPCYKSV